MDGRVDVLGWVVEDVGTRGSLLEPVPDQHRAVFLLPTVGRGPRAIHMPEQSSAHGGVVGVFGWQVDKSWLLELVYYSIEVGALDID